MSRKRSEAVTEPLDQRGLDALAEVAGYLSAGLGVDDVLSRITGALARRLEGGACRIWVRDPDGTAFHPVGPDGAPPPPETAATDVLERVRRPPSAVRRNGRVDVHVPLVFEGAELGLLEASIPDDERADTMRRVVDIVANILAPQLAAVELSEDLASEVALRTVEIDSQRRFTAKIIDSLPLGLYAIDRDYRIQAWNRKRETGTQGVFREEVLGRTVFEVMYRQPKALLKREFDRVFESGRMEQLEVESLQTGETRYYRLTKIPMRLHEDDVTHVITIGEDVTEWKSVQRQISQTEKLAAVGQLAAGVMHEINNPLATIGACVEALTARSSDLPEEDQHYLEKYLRIIDSELERCKSIVDGLLDFSRPKARIKRPADVNQIVEDAVFLVKHHDRFKNIELVRDLGGELPQIDANVEQLIQVFLALMLNAIDAMEGERGILTVRTLMNPERRDEVTIEFADTGAGIPRDSLPKIFEPFFTTKQPGRGTGLGLSICYGLVQEHGGRVNVDSMLGVGTVFKVILPVHQRGSE